MNPKSRPAKAKIPKPIYEALSENQISVDAIGIKLRSLGHLLSNQSKDLMDDSEQFSGLGMILIDLGEDLERLADRLDPVELEKLTNGK